MSAKFFQFKKNLFLAILLVIFVLPNNALAENLLTVGSANSNLTGTDSAIFSNIGSISATTTSLIRLQKNGVDLFKVDSTGNVTMGNFLTSISAANVSSGAFGSLSGNGNYSFPGNVGIGTTNPTNKLQIGSNPSNWTSNDLVVSNSAGNKAIVMSSDATMSYIWSSGRLDLYGNNTNTMSLSSGRVGIGTTAPQAGMRLDIRSDATIDGSSAITGYGYNGNGGMGIRGYGYATTGTGINYGLYGVSAGSRASAGTNIGGYFTAQGALNNYALITGNGNVGIGNPSPGYKLDVNGEANFGIGTTTNRLHNVSAPTYGTDAANKNYVDSVIAPAATTTVGLQSGFWTTGANSSIFNNNTGNVGIGTTNPGQKLDINGGISIANNASGSSNKIYLAGTDTNHYIYSSGSSGNNTYFGEYGKVNTGWHFINTNTSNELLTILGSGNVGIGTTTPNAALDIFGKAKITNNGLIYNTDSSRWLDMTGTNADSLRVPGDLHSTAGVLKIDGTGNSYVMGNLGIGTTAPNSKLDVIGSFSINGKNILSMPSNNPETGPWNPVWTAIGASKPLYSDEEFANGNNGVNIYNNSGGTAVTITRLIDQIGIPNSTGAVLKISYDGVGAVSPGFGGFYLSFTPAANRTYVQRFRAKVPVGKNLVLAENSQGDNATSYWLTNTAGTGKWEDYIRVSHAGNTGAFAGSGHVYVTGGSGAFDWYLSSVNVYEVNTPIIASPNTWNSAQTFRGGTLFPGSGIWNIWGSVGIGTTAPLAKLQINPGTNTEGLRIITSNYSPFVIRNASDTADIFRIDQNGNITGGIGNSSAWTRNNATSQLYVSNTNDKVGIGTTNPGTKLDVLSSGTANAAADAFGTAANFVSPTPSAQTSILSIASNDAVAANMGGVLGFGGRYSGTGYANWASIKGLKADATSGNYGGYLSFWTRLHGAVSAERMRIASNGNVGIGTTDPGEKLHVVGRLRVDSNIGLTDNLGIFTNGIDSDLIVRVTKNTDTDKGALIAPSTNTYLAFGKSATEVMRIASNGNVGIGTTTPNRRLDLGGGTNGRIYGIDTATNAVFTDSEVVPKKWIVDNFAPAVGGASLWATSSAGIYNVGLGNVGIGTTTPGAKLDVFGTNSAMVFRTVSPSGQIQFYNWSDGKNYIESTNANNTASQPLYFTGYGGGAGTFSFSGNVGIGTTNPTYKLQSEASDAAGLFKTTGASTDALYVQSSNSNGYSTIGFLDSSGSFMGSFGYGNVGSSWSDTILFDANNKVMQFSTNNGASKAITILTSGNVGIGTTTPNRRLDLGGGTNGRIYGIDTATNAVFTDSEVVPKKWIVDNFAPAVGGASLWATSSAGIYNVGLGNVGIGTTNPGAKLVVRGPDSGEPQLRLIGTADTARWWDIGRESAMTGRFVINEMNTGVKTERLTILMGGNIGIGTTNPLTKLHLGTAGSVLRIESSSASRYLELSSSNDGTISQNIGGLNFTTEGVNRLHIGGSEDAYFLNTSVGIGYSLGVVPDNNLFVAGNVGIGTTTPNRRLDLGGGTNGRIYGIDTATNAVFTDSEVVPKKWIVDNFAPAVGGASLWATSSAGIYNVGLGNVGIGTTNPGAKLEVNGSAVVDTFKYKKAINITGQDLNNLTDAGFYNGASLTNSPTTGWYYITVERYSDDVNWVNQTATSFGSGNIGNRVYTRTRQSGIWSGWNEHIIANSVGNVGIGTTNPIWKFVVSNTGGPGMEFDPNNGTPGWNGLYSYNRNPAGDYPLLFSASKYNFSVGNVGIGTTNPGVRLQVNGGDQSGPTLGSAVGGFALTGSNNLYGMYAGVSTNGDTWLQSQRNDNNTSVYRLLLNPSGGNVGIGTTNPITPLNVIGKWQYNNAGAIYSQDNSYSLDLAGINVDSLKVYKDIYSTTGVLKTGGTGNNWMMGNLGIGTTNPKAGLEISNWGRIGSSGYGYGILIRPSNSSYAARFALNTRGSSNAVLMGESWNNAGDFSIKTSSDANIEAETGTFVDRFIITNSGNVGINTTAPNAAYKLDVAGKINASGGLCMNGVCQTSWNVFPVYSTSTPLNLNGGNIINVNKLTVGTIDPLYRIDGTNYSSFAAAIVGGVKEEYLGRVKISKLNSAKEYEYRLDFSKLSAPDELWVWRQTVDFSPENVEVNLTPYGAFANIYYIIENEAIIFRADKPVTVSYRLSGKRVDWQNWPTKAKDQQEKPSFIINKGKVIK